MKKQLLALFLLAGLLVVASAPLVQAQITDSIVINVPFSFYAGEQELPAGEYLITTRNLPQNLLQIRSADGKHSAFVKTETAWAENDPTRAQLVFREYGDKHFLATIFTEGDREGTAISKSGLEKKLEAAGAHAVSEQ